MRKIPAKMPSYHVLLATFSPRDFDLAWGILFQAGITTGINRRLRHLTEIEAQVPLSLANASLLKSIRLLEKTCLQRKLFHQLRLKTVKKGAWANAYQKHLQPFPLLETFPGSNGLWIDPSGKKPRRTQNRVLYIKASLAFGTGTHATTQLAAELMCQVLTERTRVLDVGTGTGILAMVAARRGAAKIWAVDNDPEALEVCQENLHHNQISQVRLTTDLSRIRGRFQLITANITANVLQALRVKLNQRLAPGGYLVLSGLLYRDVPDIRVAFRDFQEIRRSNRKGWSAILLQKRMS